MVKNNVTSDSTSRIAFVAMCFDGRLKHVYQRVIKPVLTNYDFLCTRADEICQTGVIMDQIRQAIDGASLVLCDLTFENPNVFYELGIAHVLEKQTIMISQTPANIPFDVRHLRVIPYEDTKLGLLDLRDAFVESIVKIFFMGREPYKELSTGDFPTVAGELEVQREALFSNSVQRKRYAIKFLGEHGDTASFEKIQHIAVADTNSDVIRDAYISLQKIDPQKACSCLLETGLRKQKEFLVRERVVALLGSYPPDQELLKQMIEQIEDSSWGVRQTVCEVLGRWGKSEVKSKLQERLADPEPSVRLAATEALERLHELKLKKKQTKK